ncbi:MAG: fructosamine-3-kinase, partial [Paraglaciecola sp.]
YQYRKPVYQLYHLLNHALLFGGHYVESAKALLKNMQG